MKKYTARLYTRGEKGIEQTLLDFETTSMKKAREYAKSISAERGARLVSVFENREVAFQ
jgi:hypothetical protein